MGLVCVAFETYLNWGELFPLALVGGDTGVKSHQAVAQYSVCLVGVLTGQFHYRSIIFDFVESSLLASRDLFGSMLSYKLVKSSDENRPLSPNFGRSHRF